MKQPDDKPRVYICPMNGTEVWCVMCEKKRVTHRVEAIITGKETAAINRCQTHDIPLVFDPGYYADRGSVYLG